MKNRTKRELSVKNDPGTELVLEQVLGNTIKHSATLASSPTGEIAYPAGCIVVIYDPKHHRQRFLYTDNNKSLCCIAFSKDGRYLAAGEMGIKPAVVIWEIAESCSVRPLAQLRAHSFGIAAVAFSPDSKTIVSVGFQNDGYVYCWDWRNNKALASAKQNPSLKAYGVTFTDDSNTFVICGHNSIKTWQLRTTGQGVKARTSLESKPMTIALPKNAAFMGLANCKGNTYCVAKEGTNGALYSLNTTTRSFDKTIHLKHAPGFSVAASEQYVACACADGKVRLFEAGSLRHLFMLPHIAPFGFEGAVIKANTKKTHADAVCCCFSDNTTLTVAYSDHTICCWDISDPKHVVQYRSLLGHCGAIWDIQLVEDGGSVLQEGRNVNMITCSADNTVRMWQLSGGCGDSCIIDDPQNATTLELRGMTYAGDDLSILKSNKFFDYEKKATLADSARASGGIRCVRISPDGSQLATGDSLGNLRIYNLSDWSLAHYTEVHEAEILSLAYAHPSVLNALNVDGDKNAEEDVLPHHQQPPQLLASAGRDHLIHLFDCSKDHRLVHTIAEHSSAITSVAFSSPLPDSKATGFISCGADKSIIFRSLHWTSAPADGQSGIRIERYHTASSRGTVYSLALHPTLPTAVATYDKRLCLHDIVTGRKQKTFNSKDDTMQVAFHPHGHMLAASSSDRKVWMHSFPSFMPLATAVGHSDLVTAVALTNDRLISASADGCLFVWRLPCKELETRIGEIQQSIATESAPAVPEEEDEIVEDKQLVPESKSNDAASLPLMTVSEDSASMAEKPAASIEEEREASTKPPSSSSFITMTEIPAWAPPSERDKTVPPLCDLEGRWAQSFGGGGMIRLQSDVSNDRFLDPMDRHNYSRRMTIEADAAAALLRGEGIAPTGRLSISSRFFALNGRPAPTAASTTTTTTTTERPQAHQLRRDIPSRFRSTTAGVLPNPMPIPATPTNGEGPLGSYATSPARPVSMVVAPPSPPSPAGESGTEDDDASVNGEVLEGGNAEEDSNAAADDDDDEYCEEERAAQWDADTCRRAMAGLKQLLDINMELYRETKQRIAIGEVAEGEEELVEEFRSTFSSILSCGKEVNEEDATPLPSTHIMDAALEKYSELLVQIVQTKLAAQSSQH